MKLHDIALPGLLFLSACAAPALPPASDFETEEYRAQWGLDAIRASEAYRRGATGEGVLVATLDSGLDFDHREFVGRIHPDSQDVIGEGRTWNNAVHGTIVGGTFFARRDGVGMHGVAPDADIILYVGYASGCGEPGARACANFPNEGIVRAIDLAIAHDVRVINMSFGWPEADSEESREAVRAAMRRAAENDLVIVAASGNGGFDAPDFPGVLAADPALADHVVVVGAVDENLEAPDWSNPAASVRDSFLVAPGVRIFGPANDGEYRTAGGTSLAAPHVSGAIALLLSADPDLSGAEAVALLERTARDLGAPGTDEVYGHGLVDIGAAFEALDRTRRRHAGGTRAR